MEQSNGTYKLDFQAKAKEFELETEQELKDFSFEQRCRWIEEQKDNGNKAFKDTNYEEAVEIYIKALCGFEFNKKELTKKDLIYIDNKLKLPILNNMALSLM